jgi:phosphatidylglycerol:prolipoprotein diacylglycerol transferase
MIPYIKVPDLPILTKPIPITLHPFGILVATGVLVGTAITVRRARGIGFDLTKLNQFITWMLVVGFICGHVLDQLFYHWHEVLKDPVSLITLWTGLSSFGGFVGAVIGIVLWKFFEWRPVATKFARALGGIGPVLLIPLFPFMIRPRPRAMPILPFADLVLSVFPVAWIFGRSGCSVVHDHPGAQAPANALLAVEWPAPGREAVEPFTKLGPIQFIHGSLPRYDMGLLELLFTIILAACFVVTWRRRVATGTYVVAAALAYAPVRFAMDFLRVPESEGGDTRYWLFTPAQWCCLATAVTGFVVLGLMLANKKRGVDPADALRVDATPEPSEAKPQAA